MKHSIRLKLSAGLVATMIALILFGGMFGNFFLEDYYLNTKKTSLINVYNELATLIEHDENLEDENNRNTLNEYCETEGVTLLVANAARRAIYEYGAERALEQRIEAILFESIIMNKGFEEQIITETDNYKINMVTDRGQGNRKHLELSGSIGESQYFVIRVAVENVRDSISITNKFYGILSIVLIIMVTIIMLIITSRYTKPILKLAEISKKMSALNFEVHYEEKRDDEIGVLGESMNEMSKALESTISELKSANIELQKDINQKIEVDKMRSEFISNVSHELKTPIALVQGYAEGLKEGITADPESMEFYCDVIIDEANKMNKMVKNLLTLNQIEFGNEQVEMERFDVVTLIKGILNSQRLRAEQNGIKVIFEQENPVYVWGDEFQIEEVITNYISNAFNHVKGINVIKVQIKQKDGIVRVSVFNTGEPIPENELENIWVKFYKVDKARTREYGGNGIGLSIVKAIVERMGKQCGAINHEDGVEFWFELDSSI